MKTGTASNEGSRTASLCQTSAVQPVQGGKTGPGKPGQEQGYNHPSGRQGEGYSNYGHRRL